FEQPMTRVGAAIVAKNEMDEESVRNIAGSLLLARWRGVRPACFVPGSAARLSRIRAAGASRNARRVACRTDSEVEAGRGDAGIGSYRGSLREHYCDENLLGRADCLRLSRMARPVVLE